MTISNLYLFLGIESCYVSDGLATSFNLSQGRNLSPHYRYTAQILSGVKQTTAQPHILTEEQKPQSENAKRIFTLSACHYQ